MKPWTITPRQDGDGSWHLSLASERVEMRLGADTYTTPATARRAAERLRNAGLAGFVIAEPVEHAFAALTMALRPARAPNLKKAKP